MAEGPCKLYAAEVKAKEDSDAAMHQAEKTCEISKNCKVIPGNSFGGCILDIPDDTTTGCFTGLEPCCDPTHADYVNAKL